MWRFYREKKYLLTSLIVLLLDGVLIYFIPSFFHHLNYLYPMLTVSMIPFLYDDEEKKYYLIIFFLGIIYDLLYSNIFLYNAIIFSFLAIINQKIRKYFKDNLLLFMFLTVINILLYDSISFILITLTNYQEVSILDLIYKVKHSLVLNMLSVFVFWFMLKKNKRYI